MSDYTREEKYAQGLSVKLLTRANAKFDPENGERPNAIYKCFENNRSFFKKNRSRGYFLLTQSHLNFYVDYPERSKSDGSGSQYAYATTQIKDITSVCANYHKKFNLGAFILGFLLSIASAVCFLPFVSEVHGFFTFLGVVLSCAGLSCVIGSFTFARIKNYKINIGSVNGGITVMGSSAGRGVGAWTHPMTIVYHANPLENNLIEFIEKINVRITKLQERGEYAFSDYLKDWESKI